MAKLNGEEAMDITSHSDDLVFKEALTVFKDHSLDFLGLDLP